MSVAVRLNKERKGYWIKLPALYHIICLFLSFVFVWYQPEQTETEGEEQNILNAHKHS